MVYDAKIKCLNCGEDNIFAVEDKTLVSDHLRLKSQKCSNCGFRLTIIKPKHL